jgi:chromosome segregation ATPase
VTGAWIIDPAELHRLYPPIDARNDARPDAEARMGDAQADVHVLLRRAEIAEARLADARDQIEDLRQKRDRLLSLHEADQRLLVDMRERAEGGRRRWWRWR